MADKTDKRVQTTTELKLTVVLHRDGPAWVAQCLEYDIAAQGKSDEECKLKFAAALRSQAVLDIHEGRIPLSALGAAPLRYFERALLFRDSTPELPVFVPAAQRVRATARFLTEGAESVAAG